jgi:putative molybdopterin biosynthesis protein
MPDQYLYTQIAHAIRQEILSSALQPGDRLPSVRAMTARWGCTIGTVQRAYRVLADQGLVTSRAGQGTRVAGGRPAQADTPQRRLALVSRAEAFLLEVLAAGYAPVEVEDALRQALERWRSVSQTAAPPQPLVLRFCGSHDLFVAWLATHFSELIPGLSLQLSFSGSLGGLIALAEGQADLAGCHLWDVESGAYNLPFVRRLLPGQPVALVTLAHRRFGLIVAPGNPLGLQGLADLARPGVQFVNRQPGSGARVWLDARLRQAGLDPQSIPGYAAAPQLTHSAVAQAVAQQAANVGLGLQAAAQLYGLGFVELAQEPYQLAGLQSTLARPPLQALLSWLQSPPARQALAQWAGYDAAHTGELTLVN